MEKQINKGLKKINKNMIKNIIIVILSVIVIILSCILIFGNKVIKYKYYNDNLLTINNNSSFEVTANIVDYRSVAIILDSNEDKSLTGTINIKAYDDEGNEILNEENKHVIFPGCKAVSIINLPNLEEKNAGKIEIKVTENEDSYENQFDITKIKTQTNYTVDENKIVNVNLKLTNNAAEKINNIFGYIVAYKDDKIVAINSFNSNNIEPNTTYDTTVSLSATNISNEVENLDFDKLDTIISFAS